MSERMTIRGLSCGVSAKSGNMRWAFFTIGPDGQKSWLSTFDGKLGHQVEVLKEGDVVDVDYVLKNNYKTLTGLTKVEVSPAGNDGPPDEPDAQPKGEKFWLDKQKLIVAQTCLERAISLLPYTDPEIPGGGIQVNDITAKVILLADALESYIWSKVGNDGGAE